MNYKKADFIRSYPDKTPEELARFGKRKGFRFGPKYVLEVRSRNKRVGAVQIEGLKNRIFGNALREVLGLAPLYFDDEPAQHIPEEVRFYRTFPEYVP